MNNDLMFSSKSDEWATPQRFFDELNNEFRFNLDPCATDENHKCSNYYTIADNGLAKNWGGAECSSIRRIRKSNRGLQSHSTKDTKTTPLLCYSFQRGRTRSIFTIFAFTVPRFDSSKGG